MNIFYLSKHHSRIVRYMVDSHVVKMPTESTQMLSAAVRLSGVDAGYRLTHANHPCTVWTRSSLSNWLWLRELVRHMNREWRYRYNHDYNHKAYEVASSLPVPDIPDVGLTPMPQCVPDSYKHSNPIKAYRDFYLIEKSHLHSWKKRPVPSWITGKTAFKDRHVIYDGGYKGGRRWLKIEDSQPKRK